MPAFRNAFAVVCTVLSLAALTAQADSGKSFDAAAARSLGSSHLELEVGDLSRQHPSFDDHGTQFGGRGDDFRHVTAVPEPGTWAMMAAGLVTLVLVSRRRKQRPEQPSA